MALPEDDAAPVGQSRSQAPHEVHSSGSILNPNSGREPASDSNAPAGHNAAQNERRPLANEKASTTRPGSAARASHRGSKRNGLAGRLIMKPAAASPSPSHTTEAVEAASLVAMAYGSIQESRAGAAMAAATPASARNTLQRAHHRDPAEASFRRVFLSAGCDILFTFFKRRRNPRPSARDTSCMKPSGQATAQYQRPAMAVITSDTSQARPKPDRPAAAAVAMDGSSWKRATAEPAISAAPETAPPATPSSHTQNTRAPTATFTAIKRFAASLELKPGPSRGALTALPVTIRSA